MYNRGFGITHMVKCSTIEHWHKSLLTLKVLVVTIDAQCEGMGDVGSARYEPHCFPHARP